MLSIKKNKKVVFVTYYSAGSGKKKVPQLRESPQFKGPISDKKERIKMWGVTNFCLLTLAKKMQIMFMEH